MIATDRLLKDGSTDELYSQFLALLPKLETHARVCFRGIRCSQQREDKIAESIALGWKWYRRLAERGKDVSQFPMAFICLVAKAVKSGRRVTGTEKARDAMSARAQQLHGFRVEPLPATVRTCYDRLYASPHGQDERDVYEERLQNDTRTPVPDQAAFRIDWPAWLSTLTTRERRIIALMARNERTKDLSRRFQVSPGRISQLRQEFCKGWNRFCGEDVEACLTTA